ncbi:MAG: hypothetical protein ACLFM6_09730 [Spirochaetaceae bacterium]
MQAWWSHVIRGERRDILHYRLALLARRLAGATVETAFIVRLAAAELSATLLELAVVTWVAAPPSPKAAVSYIGDAARSLSDLKRVVPPDPSPGAGGDGAAAPPGGGGGRGAGGGGARARRSAISLRLPTPREVTLLSDERVRRLQRRIISVVFLRRFGLTLDDDALRVLSAYSSVSWLARNLSAAAGYGARPPRSPEARHRLRVVLPVLVHILSVHRRYMATSGVPEHSATGRSPAAGRASGGLITGGLYPRSITAQTLRYRLDAAERRDRLRAQGIRTAALELRLERHMSVITLIRQLYESRADGGGPGFSSATASRLLSTLERLRFRTTGGTNVRMDQ